MTDVKPWNMPDNEDGMPIVRRTLCRDDAHVWRWVSGGWSGVLNGSRCDCGAIRWWENKPIKAKEASK